MFSNGGERRTLSLWARDLNANAKTVSRLVLVAPLDDPRHAMPSDTAPIDPRVEVVAADGLTDETLRALAAAADVVEVPGNFPWRASTLARRALRAARAAGALCVVGVSSNRARTTVMNARGRGVLRRAKAHATAASIRAAQSDLARRADAVRIVGEGLRPLVAPHARAIYVDTASWIRRDDIQPPRTGQNEPARLLVASRLEPMKGVGNGVRAAAALTRAGVPVTLGIAGVGEEEAALRALAAAEGIAELTTFLGQLAFPGPFYELVRTVDYVLLTNLNDEQPRLIFDAIAQGAVPVCPRNDACLSLGLDARVLYERGSAADLAETVRRLITLPEAERADLRARLCSIAETRTLETMHETRRAWTQAQLAARRTEGASG